MEVLISVLSKMKLSEVLAWQAKRSIGSNAKRFSILSELKEVAKRAGV